jgi:hypothetical protein
LAFNVPRGPTCADVEALRDGADAVAPRRAPAPDGAAWNHKFVPGAIMPRFSSALVARERSQLKLEANFLHTVRWCNDLE